jgi:hypothetical protein
MPLQTPRLLSATELEYFFGPDPVGGRLLRVAGSVSLLAYGLVWFGIAIAAYRIAIAVRTGRWTTSAHVQGILLAALVCQSAIDGLSGKAGHPQYENATWIAAVLFAWSAVDALAKAGHPVRRAASLATTVLAASLLVAVASIAIRLHGSGGTRDVYGPTLANQQQVARQLRHFSAKSQLTSDVFPYQMYPDTLAVLRRLNPPPFQAPPGNLEIRYTSGDPGSGAIELVQRSSTEH